MTPPRTFVVRFALPFVANIKSNCRGGGVPDAPDGPIWNRPLRPQGEHRSTATVGADSISARGPCRYRPRRGQAPSLQTKANNHQNPNVQPHTPAGRRGRRPLQTNINGWHNCITTPLPIRYNFVHRTHTEYKICTSSTTDEQNIHKSTRFWYIFAYFRFKKVTKTAYLLPVRGCMGYSICILSTADTQMSYGGNG